MCGILRPFTVNCLNMNKNCLSFKGTFWFHEIFFLEGVAPVVLADAFV